MGPPGGGGAGGTLTFELSLGALSPHPWIATIPAKVDKAARSAIILFILLYSVALWTAPQNV